MFATFEVVIINFLKFLRFANIIFYLSYEIVCQNELQCFSYFQNVVAVAMLVRRFNFQMAIGAPPVSIYIYIYICIKFLFWELFVWIKVACLQVEMTTGATIHTTSGLNMTVTRRIKLPIVPTLEPTMRTDSDSSSSITMSETPKEDKVSSAHSSWFILRFESPRNIKYIYTCLYKVFATSKLSTARKAVKDSCSLKKRFIQ